MDSDSKKEIEQNPYPPGLHKLTKEENRYRWLKEQARRKREKEDFDEDDLYADDW